MSRGRKAQQDREDVAALIASVTPENAASAVTDGRYGRYELLEAMLPHTGPARVTCATWTMGKAEADRLGKMLERGQITELRVIADASGAKKRDGRTDAMIAAGAKIAWCKNHAKWTVVRGKRVFVETSSMNINQCRRMEQWRIEESADMGADLEALWETLWAAQQGREITERDGLPELERLGLGGGERAPNPSPVGGGVSSDRLVELYVQGLSYRAIAAEVGLALGNVYERIHRPGVWEKAAAGRAKGLEAAQAFYVEHLLELSRMEHEIALGVVWAESAQVKALDNALSRAGLLKGARIEVVRSLPVDLTVEQLTAIADGRATIDDHGQFRAVGG